MPSTLAPVYLDNQPVTIQESRPIVSTILAARGHNPRGIIVVRLRNPHDREGQRLHPADIVDRTRTQSPIYLRCCLELRTTNTIRRTQPKQTSKLTLQPETVDEQLETTRQVQAMYH